MEAITALFAPINFIDQILLKFFSPETVNNVVWPFIQIGAVVTIVAAWVAYATYLERKISAFMQARLGPMRVGPWGLLQPIADAIKLLTKEDFIPDKADRGIFFIAPYIAVAAAFIVMAVIPFAPDWGVITDINIGLLFVLAVSSVGVLALILAGWSSNSKYALLGGLRSSAQMVSYEGDGTLPGGCADVRAHAFTLGRGQCSSARLNLVSCLSTRRVSDFLGERHRRKQSRAF
jgi:NADH:ubiquinone oxidoreductase subunit H